MVLAGAFAAVCVFGSLSTQATAAPPTGMERARQLFQQSHWAEARKVLRETFSSIPAKDQAAARFLIGRSFVREAEFYSGLRQIANDVGREYLTELAAQKANRGNPYISLFVGLHALDAGELNDAARRLASATSPAAKLPLNWRSNAQLRHAAALALAGDARNARVVAADTTVEGHYWRLLLDGKLSPAVLPANAGRRDRLFNAALLFRAGQAAQAEQAAAGVDLDLHDVEIKPDPKKVLRFFDPMMLAAWERLQWERAVVVLRPLVFSGTGAEAMLAAHYAGLSLFRLGAFAEARPLLEKSSAEAPSADLKAVARVLAAACRWRESRPTQNDLTALWSATSSQAEAVLAWEELRQPALASLEPFASQLGHRFSVLLNDASAQPSGATVGRWGLLRLKQKAESGALLTDLSAHRDHSNKNKLEWNDPLLLLALAGANYRNNEYAQALETLFEMAKTLPGLRGLQWNLQGVYAARQKAGGEARISQ
jgi:hypothetical protein